MTAFAWFNHPNLSKPRRYRRWLLLAIGVGLFIDMTYILTLWPDWTELQAGRTPKSEVMQDFVAEHPEVKLQWQPLSGSIPRSQARVFTVAEDSRFYTHSGIDWQALADAIIYNWNAGKIVVGASTITQQTAKNLFLSHDRNLLRKWHEALLTWSLEAKLEKSQILHHYLNIAEFGWGIYGVEAAAKHYFGRSFRHLSLTQTAELAASLPSPRKHNPSTRTSFFRKRQARILSRLKIIMPESFSRPKPIDQSDSNQPIETVELLPQNSLEAPSNDQAINEPDHSASIGEPQQEDKYPESLDDPNPHQPPLNSSPSDTDVSKEYQQTESNDEGL